MDDDVHKSSESLPTSEEYEIIGNFEPELHIVGNGNEDQLKLSMQEVLSDLDENVQDKTDDKTYLETDASSLSADQSPQHCNTDNQKNMTTREDFSIVSGEAGGKDVSMSESLKAAMYSPSPSSVDEDLMSMSMSLVEGDYTVFDHIVYLGCAMIADPMSEVEIRRNMAVLNGQTSAKAMHISLSLPVHSEGYVVLYEPSSSYEIVNFPLHQIKTYVPGTTESKEANCIALVYESNQSHLSETIIYQCHVFRCEVPEAASKILQCLFSASKKQPKMSVSRSESFETDKSDSIAHSVKTNEQTYIFEAIVEFREDDAKGNCVSCPMDKDYFKFKCKLKKNVTVKVQQISDNKELAVDRCFGLLISPGRNVRNSDMQLIEMVSFRKFLGEKAVYSVLGSWDPNESVFSVLNKETPKDTRVYMTVAVDLVIAGIQEPVRFSIETKAKILPQNERFWNFTKKSSLHEKFYLRLREHVDADGSGDCLYHVVSLHSLTQLQRKKESMRINFSQSGQKSSQPSPASPAEPDSETDNDEPLLSGSGEVSKDCTEMELEGWAQVLSKWRQNLDQRPKNLIPLVRRGIPEALRGEVWQLLAGCHDDNEIFEAYRTLINKSTPSESIIQRDINRTFPAHEQFKEKDGVGQDALFKICKAYAVYDPEVGYCQGLSFLVAALLLHMPEEQAFAVLVKIMFGYQVRDMFRNGFDELHLKFYQLQKLMEEHLPELYAHFEDLGIEVHMFASQWFLTLFTAKFPLVVVFFIIDLFLLDAMEMIFRVAIALLTLSKKDLLALDFEGVLKHFRVSLPKKYRTEEAARQLMKLAVKIKVKGLKKYQKEYLALKEQEKLREDPIQCLQRENKRLLENNMRLEQENEDLSRELNNVKLRLHRELEKAEEKSEALSQNLQTTQLALSEMEDEKKRLSTEVAQLKEMCRRELQRAESENTRNSTIIAEYKQICNQLSLRLEKEQASAKKNLEILKAKLETCTQCSKFIDDLVPRLSSTSVKKISEQDKDSQIREAETQARELELELAQTKLDLVEAQCKNQDLTHQLNSAINELQSSKNTWFHKTLLSIRDAAKKDNPSARDTKDKDVS